MSRPVKERRICALPNHYRKKGKSLALSVDEFEVIRLIDFCGLSQAQCGDQMEVARSTIAAIYESARKKMAEALITGRSLQVCGGNVKICELANPQCCGMCGLNRCGECERDCARRELLSELTASDSEIDLN